MRSGRSRESDARDEIVAVVDAANAAFADGAYRRTCSYYTEKVREQLIRDLDANSCAHAWKLTDRALAETLTADQRDALTSYGVDPASVKITGESAVARFRPVPAALTDVLGSGGAGTITLRQVGGDWRIASLPQ